ncbi:MAG: hypothetical protein AB7P97_20305 [Hyphomonadaceae bacterium]
MAQKKGGAASAAPKGNASSAQSVADDEAPPGLLRKITPRHVMETDVIKVLRGNYEELKAKNPKAEFLDVAPVWLFKVFGVANGTKSGNTTYGDWTALTGTFEAVREHDGKRFVSGVCFLPNPAGEMLIGALKAQQETDKDSSIRFALAVSVKPVEKRDGSDGYEFSAHPIVAPTGADPLADLRAKALSFDG